MGIINKIMFWKHDDLELPKYPASPNYEGYSPDRMGIDKGMNRMESSLGVNKDPLQMADPLGKYSDGLDMDNQNNGLGDGFEQQAASSSPMNSFNKLRQTGLGQQVNQQSEELTMAKNIEIITAKIETIKSMLDFLGHKIDKIEKIAEGEQEKPVSKKISMVKLNSKKKSKKKLADLKLTDKATRELIKTCKEHICKCGKRKMSLKELDKLCGK